MKKMNKLEEKGNQIKSFLFEDSIFESHHNIREFVFYECLH
ncbi:hypothetical protein LMANV2_270025 [Leptospira interrogans serovar Manilae]|uniref:Uncharacterized protein n=1 Tax=Leptospira interrogans serovar Manilae TaxID=214675 RepID=A0AAQ1P0C1_LEPIR|nr:hypothetical protein LMANV2_270025 [Leptospira interrogans serovar Manilae]